LAFRVPDEFHTEIKLQATKEGKTLQEFAIEALRKELEYKKKCDK